MSKKLPSWLADRWERLGYAAHISSSRRGGQKAAARRYATRMAVERQASSLTAYEELQSELLKDAAEKAATAYHGQQPWVVRQDNLLPEEA